MSVSVIQGPSSGTGGITAPTMPTFVSAGTTSSAGAGGTATPGMPAGWAQNDILIYVAQCPPSTGFVTGPFDSGYVGLGPAPGIGAAAAGSTQLTVWWKRATASESAPTISIGGGSDHVIAGMFAIRGCPTTGDPFHLLMQTVKTTASTSFAGSKAATSVDACLIVYIAAQAIDAAGAQFSGAADADLANVTEQMDDSTATGIGGGFVVVTGEKAVAGPFAGVTGTWASSTVDVSTSFAMIPANTTNIVDSPRAAEVQTFFATGTAGAPNNQTWIKSTGARVVEIVALGGGGGGGNGRTANTAASGGAGGGGGFTRRIYRADDLTSTLTITAGPGGTGGASNANGGLNGADGADSTVAAGATILTAGGGKGGVGAASNSGGAGGAGGGRGTAPANANPGTQGLGGQGGGGTLADVGAAGGPGDEGGGGGGSGTSPGNGGNGGLSQSGGGGGGAGSIATTAGTGGRGGSGASGGTPTNNGTSTSLLTAGAGGGGGGNGTTGQGGNGGFPAGGGGGGGGQVGNTGGGNGGDGVITVITYF